MKTITCPHCGIATFKAAGAVNRAKAIGAPLYCGRVCFGLAQRLSKSAQQKVAEKAAYDAAYREKNRAMLKAKKAAHFAKTYDREAARAYRKQRMHYHVEYCRQPEYKEYKKDYDSGYRAKKYFGEFWEAALLVQDLQTEIYSRASKYQIDLDNGKLNKSKQRKRDYEKLIGVRS